MYLLFLPAFAARPRRWQLVQASEKARGCVREAVSASCMHAPSVRPASVACLHPPHVNVLPTGLPATPLRGVRHAVWLQRQSQRTISQRGSRLSLCMCMRHHDALSVISRRTGGRRARTSALTHGSRGWPRRRLLLIPTDRVLHACTCNVTSESDRASARSNRPRPPAR